MIKKTLLLATTLGVALSTTPVTPLAYAASVPDSFDNSSAFAWQAASATDASMSAFEKQRATVMLHKLWDRFGVGGKDAAINNNTVEAHYALWLLKGQSLSNGSYIDTRACLKKLEASRQSPSFSAGTLAKYCLVVMHSTQERSIIAPICKELLAMTDKELNEGTTVNPLFTIWGAVWIYQVLSELQGAASSSEQAQVDQLLFSDDEAALMSKLQAQVRDYIVSHQDENGRIGDSKLGRDNQTTAQALYSLSSGIGEKEPSGDFLDGSAQEARQAAAKAYEVLMAAQLQNGSWPYMPSGQKGDVDTTGCVLKALAAYEEATGFETRESKSAQMHGAAFLLSTANANLDGISKKYVSANEAMAASSAFAGLSSALCLTDKVDLAADSSALKLPRPSGVKAGSKKKNRIQVAWNLNKNNLLAADGYKVTIRLGSKVIASKTIAGANAKTTTLSLSKKKRRSCASKKLKAYVSSYRKQTLSIKSVYSKSGASKAFKLYR